MERIKDFFHDFSDIFLAIVIAGIMFFVLALNLGNWFDDSSNTAPANKSAGISEVQNDNTANNGINNNVGQEDETNRSETADDDTDTETENAQDDNNTGSDANEDEGNNNIGRETREIVIPSGTPGTGVAKILKESGLIDSENDFVRAAENLNLSGRLKSGTFKIPTGTAAEEMVEIIAGQKTAVEQ